MGGKCEKGKFWLFSICGLVKITKLSTYHVMNLDLHPEELSDVIIEYDFSSPKQFPTS